MLTSPHNETLTEIRKLAGRKWRDKLGEFVAECEDLLDAAAAAGWQPSVRLVAAGLPRDRIVATGLGPDFPVASNATTAGRQQNRRVEVVIEHAPISNGSAMSM